METSMEESFSYDENLLDKKAIRSFVRLNRILGQFPKKDGIECVLCQEKTKIRNLHDMFKAYACAVSCLVHHTKSVGDADLFVFFEVEDFVMKKIKRREMCTIRDVLEYKRDTKEMYEDALREQLVAVYKTYFIEDAIKINCEQDIESIVYKYYKLADDCLRKKFTVKSLELILTLLFRRNELIRFFKVFSSGKKSRAAFKLALLFTLKPESHISTEILLKEFEDVEFEKDSLFPYSGNIGSIRKVSKMLEDSETDIGEWFKMQKERIYWEECVQMWAANRESDAAAMDNSMVEICIKNKRYEDGWLICKNDVEGTNVSVSKACILCFKGLKKNPKSNAWKARIGEIVEYSISTGNVNSFHVLIDEVLTKLYEVSPSHRISILRRFSKMISCLHRSEDLTVDFFKGLQELCSRCEDFETRNLCIKYSEQAYEEWRKDRKKKFLFFKRQGLQDILIYRTLLEIYGSMKDCRRFYSVYQDLLKSNIELTKELCIKLEGLHIQDCEECILKRNRVVVNKDQRIAFNFLNKP
ncbi:hypothetical protein PFJ87_06g00460 [Encephalitozoon hellem]|uniref:Uncharacterized protein n=1 Tax=Encephalitozoon hellem TaxID=27973 RepID=A0ABY8CK40_ENCHE|nr:hypothetical protein PFJ87_06g00460 [Encephalitozoon hellem]